MKTQLYIHIGRPKVGSTAIQAFLNKNRKLLESLKICYPRTGLYQGASHHFSLAFLPELSDHRMTQVRPIRNLVSDLVLEQKKIGAKVSVLSSEHFWLVDPSTLPAYFGDHFETKIIAYVRRQDDVIASSYIQELRSGSVSLDCPMDVYISDEERLALLDYDRVLSRWENAFGKKNVSIRVYENFNDKNRIEFDFLSAIGLPTIEGFEVDTRKRNASPALDTLKMLDTVRSFSIGEMAKRQMSSILSDVSSELDYDEKFDSHNLLSSENREWIMSQFEDSNASLFARENISGSPFEKELPGHSAIQVDTPKLELDRTQLALLGITAYQQRQIQFLISRINQMEKSLGVMSDKEAAGRESSPKTGLDIFRFINSLKFWKF